MELSIGQSLTWSKSKVKALEKGLKYFQSFHWRRSGVFIVNFEHISHLLLVFLLLTFEQVNVCWDCLP